MGQSHAPGVGEAAVTTGLSTTTSSHTARPQEGAPPGGGAGTAPVAVLVERSSVNGVALGVGGISSAASSSSSPLVVSRRSGGGGIGGGGALLSTGKGLGISGNSSSTSSVPANSLYTWDFSKCHPDGGRVGLRNLGNTCFMNTGLQCLCHLEPLIAFFLSKQWEEEISVKNQLGTGGRLARAFATLVQHLWLRADDRVYDPRELHRSLQSVAPHLFRSFEQQDVQEFLAYMIDGLHEDLNMAASGGDRRCINNNPPSADPRQGSDEMAEEYAGACAWVQHLARDKSCMVDLFQGQLRSCLTCLECSHVSTQFDPFLYMSVPLSKTMRTLGDAIDAFLAGETLTGAEQWHCERCKKKVDAKKKIDIWKVPQILVLHLKRFEFMGSRFSKIDVPLTTELSSLDFTQYVSSTQRTPPIFDVWCVAHHSGSYGFGHYTATCKDHRDGQWYVFNDGIVERVDESRVISRTAYVLFLVRQSGPGRAGVAVRQTLSDPGSWPHLCGPPPAAPGGAITTMAPRRGRHQTS